MITDNSQIDLSYADPRRLQHPIRRAVYERWIEECGDLRGISAIDFGCGSGASSRMLIDAGARFIRGIDISSEMLQLAKEAAAQYRDGCMSFSYGDIFKPYSPEKFPLATAVLSMHYAHTRQQLYMFFANVAKALILRGVFVAVLMDPDNPIKPYFPGTMCESRWLDEPWQEGSRIESDLYGADGNIITSVTDYYWTRETHEKLMLWHNLADIHWIKDGTLLQTPLVILAARKSGNT